MSLRNLTLELSLKPFYDLSDEGVRRVCRTLFSQWRRMFDEADTVAVLFWSSDGSELLDYRGRLEDHFEWAKYIGVANPHGEPTGQPEHLQGIHENPRLYRPDAPEFTYHDLRRIVQFMRSVFREFSHKPLRIGTTFDSGPEFAKSDFKYKRHPEICQGFCLGGRAFVCCYMSLHADDIAYAGFPDGIVEGTSLGTFLGRQTKHFVADLGFDYIWFSNGFGFGMETWGACGAIFDGEGFAPEQAAEIRRTMLGFWADFRRECPELPVETRGTNLSTGMDLASDAVPLQEIYHTVKDMEVPPNSPWAALNGDFGLEIAGWLSHIAELPAGKGYPFRFYIHDPWFLNSPWLDRYDRQPHDIYLPLSLTRLDSAGKAQGPDAVKFLTADDSLGQMPAQVPDEVVPEILASLATAPDAAGPLVWIYPFDEYHTLLYQDKTGENAQEVFFGDWFMRTAISLGLPLNTVVSTSNLLTAAHALTGCVLIAPTAVFSNPVVGQTLLDIANNGGQVLLYGPVRTPALAETLGLEFVDGVEGAFALAVAGDDATFTTEPLACRHTGLYSGGALNVLARRQEGTRILAEYRDAANVRTAALIRANQSGGALAWVRGTNSFGLQKNGNRPDFFEPAQNSYPERLLLHALRSFGYHISFDKLQAQQPENILTLRRYRNAIHLAAHAPDTTVATRLRLPGGAPLFSGTETVLQDGCACYHFSKADNLECRVLVEQREGLVRCKEGTTEFPGLRRRLWLYGLHNATLRFLPESGYEDKTRILLNPQWPFMTGDFRTPECTNCGSQTVMILHNVSGDISIDW